MLSPVEITLLKSLEVGEEYLVDKAADITKMNRDSVLKAAHMLEEKEYAEVNTQIHTRYYLSDEGKQYLQEGLPEEKVLQAVNDGVTEMSQIQQEVGKREVGIAVGWLKKKGIIAVNNGVIQIESENPLQQLEEKDALKLVEEGKQNEIDKEVLSNLLKRSLVVADEKKQIFVKLVDKPNVELKDTVADLSPDLLASGRWRNVEFLEYDIHKPSEDIFTAKIHPYERIIAECRKIFLEMGFTEIKGNYVQSSFWNFDALFQPQDHPARDMQDTFYLNKYVDLDREYVNSVKSTHENGGMTGSTGWGGEWSLERARQLVLRTHTTSITIHHLANNPQPPVKAFSFDRVYRRENIDATHLPEFDQLEGVVLDKNVGFKHLLGLLKEFFIKMGFEDVRFRPGYFPYTEPSVETEVYVEGMGWIELGGAGIFRKEVTYPLGIKHKVLAWGIGVGRLAMLRMGMKDLRRLYLPDIGWLRGFPAVRSFRKRE